MADALSLSNLTKSVFNCNDQNFEGVALQVFNFQYLNNPTYKNYCDILKVRPATIKDIEKIPFLPIQFFKSKEIKTMEFDPAVIFESSGTTGSVNSKHFVKETGIYEKSFIEGFRLFYGDEKNKCIIGLLPSYLERKGSSLVYMVNHLIKNTVHENSGFYLYDHERLKKVLSENEEALQPSILIGVTYALLDFAEQYQLCLKNTIVMETGGMKGRREVLTRKQVHDILKNKLGVAQVHSEYGMTELLSQAYSARDGIFDCPPWMKILLRIEDDPFDIISSKKMETPYANGPVNIIDLANIYSCSFIATDDVGKLYKNNEFEINGRLERSDIRGCGLMIV
ncbi:MAG: acyl transferase [Ferruginibacter sp.]